MTSDPSQPSGALRTRAVHAGREGLREIPAHVPPIDLSTTYPVADLAATQADLDAWASGQTRPEDPIYGRVHNPTVRRFELAVADLEGTQDAVAFASGMAATSACLLALCRERPHVVGVRPLYGGTDHLLESGLLGTTCTWAAPGEVGGAVREDTGLVVLETPGNPTLSQVDIAAVVAQAGDVPVLVDNTFATPVLQRPAEHGAALVVHSATKGLGGHGDVMGGVVAASEPLAGALRQVRLATGGVLHPLAGYLLHRGLATLPVRVAAAQATASALAARLADHPRVGRVHYPGLPGQDPEGLLGRQLAGPGTLVALELPVDLAGASAFLAHLRLALPAVSLGSVDTLVQHPASLTHRIIGEEALAGHGIHDGLFRISVGLEDVEDLWHDLEAALLATPVRADAELAAA